MSECLESECFKIHIIWKRNVLKDYRFVMISANMQMLDGVFF